MHPPLSAAHRLAQPPRPGFKGGGLILGPGTGTSDSIPADVPEGTFIMPADSTQRLGLAARALGGDVPVKVSSGEFEISPEQVQQIGASVLDILRGVTHTPVESSPRQAFADGGVVNDVTRTGNSYSGGNVGGSITINGQAPGGTFSQIAAPAPIPAAPPVPRPTAAAALGSVPAATPAPSATSAAPATSVAPVPVVSVSDPLRSPAPTPNSTMASGWRNEASSTASSAAAQDEAPPPPIPTITTPILQTTPIPNPTGSAASQLGRYAPLGEPRRYADGGVVEDPRRRDLVGQIPTGGMSAPAADGSQSNPLNNEFGRNALNTLAALPGTSGVAARAGATGGRAASGLPAVAERVTPAAWELVDDAGALATRAGGQTGGALTRAATMAPESSRAAQMLGAAGGQLAPRGATHIGEAIPLAGQRARAATPYADIVEPMALGAPAAGQVAQGAGGAAASSLGAGRMAAAGAAGIGAAALLGGDSSASASMPNAEARPGTTEGGVVPSAGQPTAAAGASQQSGNFITRDGNSYSGPAGLGGEVPIRNADGTTRTAPAFSTVPSGGAISAQNMAAADALAGRQSAESMARLGLEGAGPGFSGVIGQQGNGNMWGRTPEQQRRDAEVQASSIHQPTAARGAAALLGMDVQALQEARNRGALDATQLQDQGATTRAVIAERGATQREAMKDQALTMRELIKARQTGKPPEGYRWTTAGGLEAIPGGPADLRQNKESQQQSKDTQDIFSILDQARPLLGTATGSYAGNALDKAAQAVGLSTPGAEAAAQLKALQGALVSKMPKMSGPQSDKDVQLYREMAGQIGDATIPAEQRRAAMGTIEQLNLKYLPQAADETALAQIPSGGWFRAPDGSIRRKP